MGRMDSIQDTPIPFAGRSIVAHRCTPADTLALADWCDMHLGRDYFFRRRHVESIIKRDHNAVYALLIDGQMAGLLILYRGSVLHNFYLSEEFRHGGIGSAVLEFFKPHRIRSKTNMAAGDPTGFYRNNGYVPIQPDPDRPHIIDMLRTDGQHEAQPGEAPQAAQSAAPPAPPAVASMTQPPVPNGQLGDWGPVLTGPEAAELEKLRKKEANRERARLYRLKKKEQDAGAAVAAVAVAPQVAVETAAFDPIADLHPHQLDGCD